LVNLGHKPVSEGLTLKLFTPKRIGAAYYMSSSSILSILSTYWTQLQSGTVHKPSFIIESDPELLK
jgi:hypothetical protein